MAGASGMPRVDGEERAGNYASDSQEALSELHAPVHSSSKDCSGAHGLEMSLSLLSHDDVGLLGIPIPQNWLFKHPSTAPDSQISWGFGGGF